MPGSCSGSKVSPAATASTDCSASGRPLVSISQANAFDKTHPSGTHIRTTFFVTLPDAEVLRPYLTPLLSTSHPLTRQPLFPDLTLHRATKACADSLNRRFGMHEIRRGAIRRAMEAGAPQWAIVALTPHNTQAGSLAYAAAPSAEAQDAAALLSAMI